MQEVAGGTDFAREFGILFFSSILGKGSINPGPGGLVNSIASRVMENA